MWQRIGSLKNCLLAVRTKQPIRTAVINFAMEKVALETLIVSVLNLKRDFCSPSASDAIVLSRVLSSRK